MSQFRIIKVGRKWVYGFHETKDGAYSQAAKLDKTTFPPNKYLTKGDIFNLKPNWVIGKKLS